MVSVQVSESAAKDLLRAISYGMLAISRKENDEGIGDRIRSNLTSVQEQIEKGLKKV